MNRFKLVEIRNFLKTFNGNMKITDGSITIKDKIKCRNAIIINLLKIVWNGVTTPLIYPIWYLFRTKLTPMIYQNTSWQEILKLINENKTNEAKKKLLANGKFLYWIWTYSDLEEPMGRGGLPISYGPNTFWYRFKYSAIRNPRFNCNYIDFRTEIINEVETIIDTRNFHYMHKSYGISDSPDGIYFKWMRDTEGKCYFIYEDNNKSNLFYIGYTGMLYDDIGYSGGRFETGYRETDGSYLK